MASITRLPPRGANEYRCAFCQREFRCLEHLQRHTRRHTHEKPFTCSCGASFSRKDLLRRHESIAHSTADSLPPRSGPQGLLEDAQLSGSECPRLTPNDQNQYDLAANASTTSHRPPFQSPPALSVRTIAPDDLLRSASTSLGSRSVQRDGKFEYWQGSAGIVNHLQEKPSTRGTIACARSQGIYENQVLLPSPRFLLETQVVPHFSHPVVTEQQRSKLILALNGYIPPGESFPSSDSLTRYLAGYFTGFYPHVPFSHAPTFRIETCSTELCLAMMALGAAHRYEFRSALKLFYASKAILLEQQRQRELAAMERLISTSGNDSQITGRDYDNEIGCLLCLLWFSIWQKDPNLNNESMVLRFSLAQALKLSGLEEIPSVSNPTWENWARLESARRAKLLAFCVLNIQDIAYRMSPIIWYHEIRLRLACSFPEWTAPDAITWGLFRRNILTEQPQYNEALKDLLSMAEDPVNDCLPTPVSNYILLHGLLQQIMWSQILPADFLSESLADGHMLFRTALRRWTIFWQQTFESNLEPLDPNGPLPFQPHC